MVTRGEMMEPALDLLRSGPMFQRKSHTDLYTLTVLIPRYYNANPNGSRKKIEWRKLRQTILEMHLLFPGYTATRSKGWSRDDNVYDHHLQFQMDFMMTPSMYESICLWKKILRRRFRQRAMYMKVANGGSWV